MPSFTKPKALLTRNLKILLIQLFAFVVYFNALILTYITYDNTLDQEKNETLDNYYETILNHTLVQLDYLLQKLPPTQNNIYPSINVDSSDIKACYKQQCIRSNLFEMAYIINKYVPKFIYYEIKLNKQLLHYNNKISKPQLKKTYYINEHNQISINVSIEPRHWNKIKIRIFKPFLIILIFSTLLLALFILSNRHIKKFYSSYFNLEIEKSKENYQQELTQRENSLLKKIWDLEYIKEKDQEINYLFFQEVTYFATHITNVEHLTPNIEYSKNSPYSFMLYYNEKHKERINVKHLIEVFSNRFSKIEDNVVVSIKSSEQSINFLSKVFLYQIIYSIITYLIFILKEQSCKLNYNLRFNITTKSNKLCLLFEYEGFPLHDQEGLLKFSSRFFKKHANPFLLNLNQIFDILKENNFYCKVSHNNINYIEIINIEASENLLETKDNIIQLPIRK